MSKGAVNFDEKNVEYYTPKSILDKLGGGFDYDPATVKEKAYEFGIPNYDTIETDGLKRDWTQFRKIWINPPFNKKKEFLAKALETYNKCGDIEIYFLCPVEFITTTLFHKMMDGRYFILYIPTGRIKFERSLIAKPTQPAFGSVIVCLDTRCVRSKIVTLEI